MTDDEELVLGVLTTTASKNEIANLEQVLETVNLALPKDIPLKADKGYQSKKNVELLKQRNLKNHILKKAYKNNPLTRWRPCVIICIEVQGYLLLTVKTNIKVRKGAM